MAKITRKELLKIADISRIEVRQEEIDGFIQQLDSVLGYAERVSNIADDITVEEQSQVNVMRDDVEHDTPSEPLLEQAPDIQDNYFVVPRILEHDE